MTPERAGMLLDFASAYSPWYEKPPNSFLNFAVDLAVTSGEPGPMAPAANLVSHFQVPRKSFMNDSSSFEGVGIGGGPLGAAAAAAGAAAGAAAPEDGFIAPAGAAAGFIAAGAAGAGLPAAGAAAGAIAGAGGEAGFFSSARAKVVNPSVDP